MFQKNATLGFVSLIVLAIATRFIPHAPNFTAVGAAALFGGFALAKRWQAFLLPVLIMFLSDLVLNNVVYSVYYDSFQWFTPGFGYMYAAFILTVLLGYLQGGKLKVLNLLGAGVTSALLFFIITNFGVWQSGMLYPQTFEGLMTCYAAALPFLANSLISTLVYGAILFGSAYYLFGLSRSEEAYA
jgi:hypothetical protein